MQIRQKIGKFKTRNLGKALSYLRRIETKDYRILTIKNKQLRDKWEANTRLTSLHWEEYYNI